MQNRCRRRRKRPGTAVHSCHSSGQRPQTTPGSHLPTPTNNLLSLIRPLRRAADSSVPTTRQCQAWRRHQGCSCSAVALPVRGAAVPGDSRQGPVPRRSAPRAAAAYSAHIMHGPDTHTTPAARHVHAVRHGGTTNVHTVRPGGACMHSVCSPAAGLVTLAATPLTALRHRMHMQPMPNVTPQQRRGQGGAVVQAAPVKGSDLHRQPRRWLMMHLHALEVGCTGDLLPETRPMDAPQRREATQACHAPSQIRRSTQRG